MKIHSFIDPGGAKAPPARAGRGCPGVDEGNMYKSASEFLQGRASFAALNSIFNKHGIDPSAFVSQNEDDAETYARLLRNAKVALQSKVTRLNSEITRAQNSRNLKGQFVPRAVWSGWQAEKKNIVSEIQQIEIELADIKNSQRLAADAARRDDKLSFERAFQKAAKAMLAGPVYDRLCTAALHMMSDGEGSS